MHVFVWYTWERYAIDILYVSNTGVYTYRYLGIQEDAIGYDLWAIDMNYKGNPMFVYYVLLCDMIYLWVKRHVQYHVL